TVERRLRWLAAAGIARAIQRPLRRPTLDAVVDGSIRAPGAGIGVCPGRPTPRRARCVTAGGRVLGGPPRGRPAIPDERGIVPVCVSVVEGAGRYPTAALASALPDGAFRRRADEAPP